VKLAVIEVLVLPPKAEEREEPDEVVACAHSHGGRGVQIDGRCLVFKLNLVGPAGLQQGEETSCCHRRRCKNPANSAAAQAISWKHLAERLLQANHQSRLDRHRHRDGLR
jgi:hypothetical protein